MLCALLLRTLESSSVHVSCRCSASAMAMAAAGGEPPKAQKLRIMFKGTKLVEVSTPLRDSSPGEQSLVSIPQGVPMAE